MTEEQARYAPGRVRDAILQVLSLTSEGLTVKQIEQRVEKLIGHTPTSSVRSYLRLNTPDKLVREARGVYRVNSEYFGGIQRAIFLEGEWNEPAVFGNATRLL